MIKVLLHKDLSMPFKDRIEANFLAISAPTRTQITMSIIIVFKESEYTGYYFYIFALRGIIPKNFTAAIRALFEYESITIKFLSTE